ncbi:ornithine carbamoyltransferase [Alkalihalobacterium chitinilyticum]|uniref:Ornithine carbamoyltransferase n=1 Tax=Alkalihalobacterium chitinilyticum TaxID=2980103 RepID=A0ABT5VAU3_9BACI|nr:ornithine carbamoyltransferase [Alkalihalobacterium chitinilyticum]MDE5412593.1 ornithine carbamoyltransferase [Alkalihalobacterium chitinilyticum]
MLQYETKIDANQLKGKDFLTILDFSSDEIFYLLELASQMKREQKEGKSSNVLQGKSLGMIFENASTRTRVSFEVGMTQLGGHALFLSPRDLQIGRGEPISDTAQVLSRYVDAIMVRTNSHEKVEELAKYSTVPVINALTDYYHPCQALADLLTIYEQKGTFKGNKLVYVGDGNNVAHSLVIGAAKVGMDVAVATPAGYEMNQDIVEKAFEVAKSTGSTIKITNDPVEAVTNADIIYTDVWASMGYESEQKDRELAFGPYQVNSELVSHAKNDYIFLHCLPAHRGEEVTADIIDGQHSVVFDEAENRLHVQKAILASVIK